MNIQLEKYTGKASRHKCPKCGDNFSFALYIDESGKMINRNVGRCNHESSCGYHYTPKQFFTDNPTENYTPVETKPVERKPMGTIPFEYVEKSVSYKSNFVYFLCSLFDRCSLESPTIERVMQGYLLGATKDGDVIYWQIDQKKRVRTGKVMKYDKNTGKRVKELGGVNWIHSLMKKKKLLPEDFNLTQCLFGEHLLKVHPTKTVALVESEKSALIASGVYPEYIWLATGGKSQLSIEKLKVLRGRTIIMFPDAGCFEYWGEKAKGLESIAKVIISDLLEKNATPEDLANGIDIADWLIRELSTVPVSVIRKGLTESERVLQIMLDTNPALQTLIDKLNLVIV